MNIGAGLLILTTFAYALAAIAFACQGDRPLAIVYVGYTIANFGVIWLAYR